MSETAVQPELAELEAPAPPLPRRGRLSGGVIAGLIALAVALTMPFWLSPVFLNYGFFAGVAALGALGLNLLLGTTGLLSLGHSFFLAVGAYGYAVLASEPTNRLAGVGLPTAVAAVGAVLLAGLAGLAFSPIAGRLRGIYLGVASIGLVFLGEHIIANAESYTNTNDGRLAPALNVAGFRFADVPGETLKVAGLEVHENGRVFWLATLLVAGGAALYRNIRNGRPGRALMAVRDGELAAGVMGVHVNRAKGAAFLISSMYAGLAGVLLAQYRGRLVPEQFQLDRSIDFLVMVVIGGLGSVVGSIIGAIFVAVLPEIFQRYVTPDRLESFANHIPLLAIPGGLSSRVLAQFTFGAVLILVLLFEPGGLAALGRRLFGWVRGRRGRPDTASASAPGADADPAPAPDPAPDPVPQPVPEPADEGGPT